MIVFRKLLQGLIRAYQLLIVPIMPAGSCRFHPGCSSYAMDAVETHGAIRGGWLALKRIGRCHPWGPSGFDPVPPVTAEKTAANEIINAETGKAAG